MQPGLSGGLVVLMMEQAFEGATPVAVRSGYDGSVVFAQRRNGGLAVPRALVEEAGFEEPRFAGIAIAGILVMAFLANALVARLGLATPLGPFLLLGASLLGGILLARAGGLPSTPLGALGTVVVLTGTMFFSGMVFSTLPRSASDLPAVMAANLMGTMLGGLLEYNSMYFGFRFLYWLALACYTAALLASSWRARVR